MGFNLYSIRRKQNSKMGGKLSSFKSKFFNPNSSHWLPIGVVSVILLTGAAAAGELSLTSLGNRLTGNEGTEDFAINTPGSRQGQISNNLNPSNNQSDSTEAQANDTGNSQALGSLDVRPEDDGVATTVVNADGSVTQTYESDDGQTKVDIKIKSGSESTGEVDIDTKTRIDIDSDSHTSVYINGQKQGTDTRRNPRYNR